MKPLHWIALPHNTPILDRLHLEEAMLRSDERNFCIVGLGSPRSIVLGISGDPDTLLDLPKVAAAQVPLIRRFSGGGTVIVDENTLFITFILQKKDLEIAPFPESILRWTTQLYTQAWELLGFQLKENDYCILDKKCGGNAQYIRKERFVHHTSFLWDYCGKNMELLKLPPKRPAYRLDRSHDEFLCKLKSFQTDPKVLLPKLRKELAKQFSIQDLDLSSLKTESGRRSTQQIFP